VLLEIFRFCLLDFSFFSTLPFSHSARLHCKTKSFYFYCDSDQDRKKWIKDINQSIGGNHQEEIETRKIHAGTTEAERAREWLPGQARVSLVE
jgi:hypothetical protein